MRISLLLSLLALLSSAWSQTAQLENDVTALFNGTGDRHTNNWAVLVDTSRYWFNYRVSPVPRP